MSATLGSHWRRLGVYTGARLWMAVNALGIGGVMAQGSTDVGFANLGGGLAGTNGIPYLQGQGSCDAGTPFDLALSLALPSSYGAIVLAYDYAPTPFLGGVFVCDPANIIALLGAPIDTLGTYTFASIWPDVGAGGSLFFQMGVLDPAAIEGIALSNIVRGRTAWENIPSGNDLLEASGVLHLSVPSGFFAIQSSPYNGDIPVTGARIGTAGAFELGTASMVLGRLDVLQLDGAALGHTVSCPVEVQVLKLVGNQAISAANDLWDVTVDAEPFTGANGYYEIAKAAGTHGALSGSLSVSLVASFRSHATNTMKSLPLGTVSLDITNGSWTNIEQSPTAALSVAGLRPGVALTTALASSALDLVLVPASADPLRPAPMYVDPTATVHPSASLGRDCSVDQDVTIDAGTVIGPSASISARARIGKNVTIGDSVSIGMDVHVADGAIVEDGSTVGDGSTIGARAHLGNEVSIGAGSMVDAGAVIGSQTSVGSLCTIGAGANVEHEVQMGVASSVLPGITIASGTNIAASSTQSTSTVRCWDPSGNVSIRSLPQSGWPSWPTSPMIAVHDGGVVALPAETGSGATSLTAPTGVPPDPSNPPAGYTGLGAAIGNTIAPPINGGTGQTYTPGVWECGWFAEQLRRRLADMGYETTFTCVSRLNPNRHWYNRQPKWIDGHALVDVHWADGTVSWIEAQHAGAVGVDSAWVRGLLDGNGNGTTEYVNGSANERAPSAPTDGDIRVVSYSSRAEAAASGSFSLGGN